MYKLSKRSLERLDTCHVDLQTVMKEAIKTSPFDYGISWGHRSPVKQNELYQQGRTTEGNIVTYVDGYKKKSKHNHLPSLACDIMCYVHGKVTWEHSVYLEVGLHIMEVAERLFEDGKIDNMISWGGFFKRFKDMPHYYI